MDLSWFAHLLKKSLLIDSISKPSSVFARMSLQIACKAEGRIWTEKNDHHHHHHHNNNNNKKKKKKKNQKNQQDDANPNYIWSTIHPWYTPNLLEQIPPIPDIQSTSWVREASIPTGHVEILWVHPTGNVGVSIGEPQKKKKLTWQETHRIHGTVFFLHTLLVSSESTK